MKNELKIDHQSNERFRDVIDCGMLDSQLVQSLRSINDKLVDAWKKRQVFRTETEMRVSVLNDGSFPTKASKYWQSVREQSAMLDNLAAAAFDYRRNELKLKKLHHQLECSADEFESDELVIDIDECNFKKASIIQVATDRVREILLWEKIKNELDDGTFDTDNVNTHQMQSLIKSLSNRKACLSASSSQAEVLNVLGPLETAIKLSSAKSIT